MLRAISFALLSVLCAADAEAQWAAQASGTQVRLRGVSAVSREVAWASGDRGTYARTTDGGRTWRAGVVPGAEELDFRDVDAFDAETAYLLAIGPGEKSRIYKTTDGGRTWVMQFQNKRPAAFFDSMAFWDRDRGIAVSDPVGGRFLIVKTTDGGRTWTESPPEGMPPALEGEGAFAASGTCIAVWGKAHAWFGTGGPKGARVFRTRDGGRTWEAAATPLVSGTAAGVFSVAFTDARRGVIVGGDYTKEQEAGANVAVTHDGGKTWALSAGRRPNGYRSCVVVVRRGKAAALVAVGPNGSDYSLDGGRSWVAHGAEGFHSASFFNASAGWAVGEGGRIANHTGGLPSAATRPR
jgi:photosystem II stability/assembly factor-like uncharacterized protein